MVRMSVRAQTKNVATLVSFSSTLPPGELIAPIHSNVRSAAQSGKTLCKHRGANSASGGVWSIKFPRHMRAWPTIWWRYWRPSRAQTVAWWCKRLEVARRWSALNATSPFADSLPFAASRSHFDFEPVLGQTRVLIVLLDFRFVLHFKKYFKILNLILKVPNGKIQLFLCIWHAPIVFCYLN